MKKKEIAIQFYAECLHRRREDPELDRQLRAIETIGRKFLNVYGVDQLDRYAGPLRWLHNFETSGRQGGWTRFLRVLVRSFKQSLQVVVPQTQKRIRAITPEGNPSYVGPGLRLSKAVASRHVKRWNDAAKLAESTIRFRVSTPRLARKRKEDVRTIISYEISFGEQVQFLSLDAFANPDSLRFDPNFSGYEDDENGDAW